MTVIDVLRRAGVDVVVGGLASGAIRGSRGVQIVPDSVIDEVLEQSFSMVVFPGGMPAARILGEDARVKRLLDRAVTQDLWLGAICAAPAQVLAKAGLLNDRPATGHPSMKEEIPLYQDKPVVIAGRIVTSQAPGTAMAFAITLVGLLQSETKARKIADSMLVSWSAP